MHKFGRLFCAVAVAAATLTAAPAFAQQYNDEGIGFGVLGGLTRSSISLESDLKDFYDIGQSNGWMAGIWFGGNRNGTLGFMGEISYVVKGAKENTFDEEVKLHYIEIPALVRVNLGQTSNKAGFLVYPMFGPYVDIQIKAEDQDGEDIKDNFNGFDAGLMGGIGIEVARIGVEVRYGWGLKGIAKEDDGFSDLQDSKNRTLQVLAKIRLN